MTTILLLISESPWISSLVVYVWVALSGLMMAVLATPKSETELVRRQTTFKQGLNWAVWPILVVIVLLSGVITIPIFAWRMLVLLWQKVLRPSFRILGMFN